jgi:hypothetical protein
MGLALGRTEPTLATDRQTFANFDDLIFHASVVIRGKTKGRRCYAMVLR